MGGMWPLPPRTEPLTYTGTRYTDEFDEAEDARWNDADKGGPLLLSCQCFDAATAEWAPEPCDYCKRMTDEGITT